MRATAMLSIVLLLLSCATALAGPAKLSDVYVNLPCLTDKLSVPLNMTFELRTNVQQCYHWMFTPSDFSHHIDLQHIPTEECKGSSPPSSPHVYIRPKIVAECKEPTTISVFPKDYYSSMRMQVPI